MIDLPERPAELSAHLVELCATIAEAHPTLKTCRALNAFDEQKPDTSLASAQCPCVLIVPGEQKYHVQTAGFWYARIREFKFHVVGHNASEIDTLVRSIATQLSKTAYTHAHWLPTAVTALPFSNPLLHAQTLTCQLLEN